MANPDDEQLKSYLKSFHPVVPEPLRTRAYPAKAGRLFALATTAAVSLAAIGLVVVLLSRSWQHVPRPATKSSPSREIAVQSLNSARGSQISTTLLTKLALDDHEAFDELMTEKVRTQFPLMKDEQSALRVLAKE